MSLRLLTFFDKNRCVFCYGLSQMQKTKETLNKVIIFGAGSCRTIQTVHALQEIKLSHTIKCSGSTVFQLFFHITWRWWKCHHLLAIQVYSPRACLWERHVYCAVLSTSMECNIYHGCHSQVEMLIQNISSLGYSTFCLISDSFQALKELNTFLQLSKTSWYIF